MSGHFMYMPESLGECDRRQVRIACKRIIQYVHGDLGAEGMLRLMAVDFLELDGCFPGWKSGDLGNLDLLVPLMLGFFDQTETGLQVKTDFERNPMPWLRPGLWKYYGPEADFDNITFGEYVDARNHFVDYAQTGNESYLNLMIAVLWRRSSLSRKRPPYDPSSLAPHVRRIGRLDIGQRFACYLFFAGFQKYLSTARVHWEGRELDLGILFEGEGTGDPLDIPGLGMKEMEFVIAESQIFGTLPELRATDLWDVLVRMYSMRRAGLMEEERQRIANKK